MASLSAVSAGSGRSAHEPLSPSGSPSHGDDTVLVKKRRIERGKKACLPCRSRKCRCGGTPPGPCPNCLDDSIDCQWPTEDGRSSQARKDRARQRRLQSMMVRGLGRPQPKAERESGLETPGAAATGLSMFDLPACAAGPSSVAPSGAAALPETPQFALPSQLDAFDPEQFILAMSSQLPTVEDGLDTSPAQVVAGERSNESGRIVKITWWRPHGPTAIAPGLKRLSLKVRVEPSPQPSYLSPGRLLTMGAVPEEMFRADGMPSAPIMRHLLDVFAERLECVFPVLSREALLRDVEAGTGSVFLFNCIAATAARFSTHPAIARPQLKPHEYGNVFAKRAKELMPSMFAVPSRDTVMALALLAHVGFGNGEYPGRAAAEADSESEEWMFTGMAVRMAVDLGLHLDQGDEDIGAEEQRLNCLAFWSVLLLDYALSFGVGRQTTFRIEEITQRLPTETDVRPPGSRPHTTRSPFPLAVRQMLAYGPLINLLNGPVDDPVEVEAEIAACRAAAVAEYNALPEDMQWSATNLQMHRHAAQAPIYVHIHLWMHTVIASGYLTGRDLRKRGGRTSGVASGHTTPVSGAPGASAQVWRNSARTIGDILVLSDVIDPHAYLALPFANQSLYVAGCCYIKEIEGGQGGRGAAEGREKQADLFRSMLASVATSSIATLQRGLARQATYWAGVAWVNGALAQRVAGIHADNVDLAQVTEQLQTYVSVPDPGLVGKHHTQDDPTTAGPIDFGASVVALVLTIANLDLLTLPFDLEKLAYPGTDLLYL